MKQIARTSLSLALMSSTALIGAAPAFAADAAHPYPLRAVAEAAGARVTWEPTSNSATVTLGDRQVTVRIGERGAQVLNGRTMVPADILTDALGVMARYDAAMTSELRPAWAEGFEALARHASASRTARAWRSERPAMGARSTWAASATGIARRVSLPPSIR